MTVNINTARALRGYVDIKQLVQAVLDSDDPKGETNAIEWKTAIDFSRPSGAYTAAKAILAFANRDVRSANRFFEGLAYFIAGVEPGRLVGVPPVDGEQLAPALARYIGGAGPRWHHENITVGDFTVIVITVEAPRDGDPIHTLRREYTENEVPKGRKPVIGRDGDIYIRRGAATERANSAEIEGLQARLLAKTGSQAMELDIVPAGDSVRAWRIGHADQAFARWLDMEVTDLLRSVPTAEVPSSVVAASIQRLTESRRPSEFRASVAKWADKMRERELDQIRTKLFGIMAGEGSTSISVANREEEALDDVLVTISTPRWLEQHFEEPDLEMPKRPRAWGRNVLEDLDISFPQPAVPTPRLAGDRWVTQIRVGLLHPEAEALLDPFLLFAVDPPEGAVAELRVTAAAKNRAGVFRMDLPVPLSKSVDWDALEKALAN